jgi:hypothetical protein
MARVLVIVLLVALGFLVLRARCRQVSHQRAAVTAEAVSRLAGAIARSEDLASAEAAFEAAVHGSVGDPYPIFCLSAVREMRGQAPPLLERPAGWPEAVAMLADGRLDEAQAAFERFAGEPGSEIAPRASFYLRLIEDLRAAWPDVDDSRRP